MNEITKEQKTLFIKWVLRGVSLASITYLGYNLFSGEVMTTIDNWIATGTFTLAQISSALLIIVNNLFAKGLTTIRQDNQSLSVENSEIKNEIEKLKQDNAQMLEILLRQEERYNEAIKTQA